MQFLDNFRLGQEKEDFQTVSQNIQNGIEFKGTNLWILVFAIFIASLGLNVNSTAVIIGAMLVSPLMGPIIGLGFSMSINDLSLLKKSFLSYLFAALVSLATSTLFFLISPINEAHSEILARTSPNIYDVLIALFGGLAGILAISSKLKGNVIPGVAIATALMPPLCTAGYGLATLQFTYFFGAFYLFLINTVFIALATFITIRFLKFPHKHLQRNEDEIKAKQIILGIVLITVLPSIYFGYTMIQENKFQKDAVRFIEEEAIFQGNLLLSKTIDSKSKSITLTYIGQGIEEKNISLLKKELFKYNLENASLVIQQGFAHLKDNKVDTQTKSLTLALSEKEKQIQYLQSINDSLMLQHQLDVQIQKELSTLYPTVQTCIIQQLDSRTDTPDSKEWIAVIQSNKKLQAIDKSKIEEWIKTRLKINKIQFYFVI